MTQPPELQGEQATLSSTPLPLHRDFPGLACMGERTSYGDWLSADLLAPDPWNE
jgi:hypothetical protein